MDTYILPFLSVLIGYLVAIWVKPKNKKAIKLLLAFSGAFLLTMTVSHLLPEVYAYAVESPKQEHINDINSTHEVAHDHEHHHEQHHHEQHHEHDHEHHHEDDHSHGHVEHNHDHGAMKTIGLFIMLGIVFQIILEYFSKGAEHGHVHIHDKMTSLPWLLFISLCLHALLEGMPISHHEHLAWAIAVHHLPIAVILTLFFLQAGLDKKMIFIFMFIFALMTPLGTYAAQSLTILSTYYIPISAFVIGILFHISSTIIFESNEGHTFNLAKLIAILVGIFIGFIII